MDSWTLAPLIITTQQYLLHMFTCDTTLGQCQKFAQIPTKLIDCQDKLKCVSKVVALGWAFQITSHWATSGLQINYPRVIFGSFGGTLLLGEVVNKPLNTQVAHLNVLLPVTYDPE